MKLSDNFWNNKRVELGFSVGQIAEFLAVSKGTVYNYLYGYCHPKEEHLNLLCKLFNVDTETGKEEFDKIYKRCHADPSETEEASEETAPVEVDIFEAVYGVISYKDFIKYYELVAAKNIDALRLIYNKVDFSTYRLVSAAIENWCK